MNPSCEAHLESGDWWLSDLSDEELEKVLCGPGPDVETDLRGS